MQDKHLSEQRFKDLPLHPLLKEGVSNTGFEFCTPIQALALPIALQGKDVAGQAQTGTGKTAAFLLATFHHILTQQEAASSKDKAESTAVESSAQSETNAGDDGEALQIAGKDASETPEADGEIEPEEQHAEQKADSGESDKATKAKSNPKPAKEDKGAIKALILAPTRELAIQIHKDAVELAKSTDIRLALAYGGTGYEEQKQTIEAGVDVLIGTPGRVIDYYKQKVFHLNAIQVAVMDEADRMFDLGFITDIRYLLRRMPEGSKRLNLLFSATLSFRVDELAYEHMNGPEKVKVESEMVVQRIEEIAYYPAQNEKITLLINLLKEGEEDKRTLVFINTKHEGNKVAAWLEANELPCAILSGDVPQVKRERLLKKFHDGKVDILVATDVAARGLHIPDVSHVINYDLPQDAEDYVHRSGRTARAGASGHAISLACEKYAYSMMDIEEYIGHRIPIGQITNELLVEPTNKPDLSKLDSADSKRRGSSGRDAKARSSSTTRSQVDGERPDRPNVKYVNPLEAKPDRESKFVAPPSKFSSRFGEVPALG